MVRCYGLYSVYGFSCLRLLKDSVNYHHQYYLLDKYRCTSLGLNPLGGFFFFTLLVRSFAWWKFFRENLMVHCTYREAPPVPRLRGAWAILLYTTPYLDLLWDMPWDALAIPWLYLFLMTYVIWEIHLTPSRSMLSLWICW